MTESAQRTSAEIKDQSVRPIVTYGERTLELANAKIDKLWCVLHDIAGYNITDDIRVVQAWAREALSEDLRRVASGG